MHFLLVLQKIETCSGVQSKSSQASLTLRIPFPEVRNWKGTESLKEKLFCVCPFVCDLFFLLVLLLCSSSTALTKFSPSRNSPLHSFSVLNFLCWTNHFLLQIFFLVSIYKYIIISPSPALTTNFLSPIIILRQNCLDAIWINLDKFQYRSKRLCAFVLESKQIIC